MNKLLEPDFWNDSYKDVCARTIIMTFYETGIRLSELVGLDDVAVDCKSTDKGYEKKQTAHNTFW